MALARPATRSPFLVVPQEIRDHVYSFIDDPIDICHSLWVCRQLYNETYQLFWDRYTLDLDVFADAKRRMFRVRVDHPNNLLPHPLQTNKRPRWWSFQLHLAHGQDGGKVMQRLESIPEESKPLLKTVNLFVPTVWASLGPPIPLRWQCYSCQCTDVDSNHVCCNHCAQSSVLTSWSTYTTIFVRHCPSRRSTSDCGQAVMWHTFFVQEPRWPARLQEAHHLLR